MDAGRTAFTGLGFVVTGVIDRLLGWNWTMYASERDPVDGYLTELSGTVAVTVFSEWPRPQQAP